MAVPKHQNVSPLLLHQLQHLLHLLHLVVSLIIQNSGDDKDDETDPRQRIGPVGADLTTIGYRLGCSLCSNWSIRWQGDLAIQVTLPSVTLTNLGRGAAAYVCHHNPPTRGIYCPDAGELVSWSPLIDIASDALCRCYEVQSFPNVCWARSNVVSAH
jgi:hypothetical protein